MTAKAPRGVTPEKPGPGQESVWDYPRPPRLEPTAKMIAVRLHGSTLAQTRSAWQVCETSHPPTYYLPPESVTDGALVASSARATLCEWKGAATYWDVVGDRGQLHHAAAWSYERPTHQFAAIAGFVAFSPSILECYVDGELARSQEGGFYAGWITDDVVGPFKGVPGSRGW